MLGNYCFCVSTFIVDFFTEQAMPPKKRVRANAEKIQQAVNEVLQHNMSIRSIAQSYNISKSHLARLVKEAKKLPQGEFVYRPLIGNRKIFTQDQEQTLSEYLKLSAKMCFGLTTVQVRELAYQYAVKLDIAPDKWLTKKIASVDWLKLFLKRNTTLAVRKPESTSLARTTGFNKVNVSNFFNNLEKCYQKNAYPANMIWNLDETGCSTVTNTPKIVAGTGVKRVGQISSAERGSLVTMLAFTNAAGGSIPPVFIFPRVHYKDHMLQDGPTGSLGLANQSGWITENCFLESLKHFVKHVKPSEVEPALIILDNHQTHITINVILFARQNHLVIITFPPHCSHRMQPLDVTVFGPFKARYRVSMNDWMTSNPGKCVTIYNVAQFAKDAYYSAFSLQNIISGFKNTGIYPLNTHIFTEDDFLPSAVTDRPLVEFDQSTNKNCEVEQMMEITENIAVDGVQERQNLDAIVSTSKDDVAIPSTSKDDVAAPSISSAGIATPSTSKSGGISMSRTAGIISPEMIRPFPKALPRTNPQQRRRVTSKIITSTPEKDRLLAESMTELLSKETTDDLTHVKDIFKTMLGEKDQKKKTKSKIKGKSITRVVNVTKPKKKKVYISSSSSEKSLTDVDSDSCDDCSDSTMPLQKRSKRMKSAQLSDNECCVCKEKFETSKEDWFQCKLCEKWANESCGIKGVFNFFCSMCH